MGHLLQAPTGWCDEEQDTPVRYDDEWDASLRSSRGRYDEERNTTIWSVNKTGIG